MSRSNFDYSCLHLKELWPIFILLQNGTSILPTPERIWTHPACPWRNSDWSHPLWKNGGPWSSQKGGLRPPLLLIYIFFHVPILCMFKWTYLLGYNFPKYKPISNLNPSNPDQDKAFPEYKWMNVEWIYAQDKLSSRCPYHIPSQTCTHDCKFNHNIRQATLTTPLFELKLSMAVI